MIKKYWPIAASWFLCMIVPLVIIHTRFRSHLTIYMTTVAAIEMLLFVAAVIVWRNRRKTTVTERL